MPEPTLTVQLNCVSDGFLWIECDGVPWDDPLEQPEYTALSAKTHRVLFAMLSDQLEDLLIARMGKDKL